MLANVPLRDVRPTVMVCPNCAQRLMDITDVQWAATKLEFTYGCSGCGTEQKKAVEGTEEIVAFTSRASTLLRNMEIFSFNPDSVQRVSLHRAKDTRTGLRDHPPAQDGSGIAKPRTISR